MDDEATIVINGRECSPGEAMTIRVALEAFATDLVTNGLGDDEHGRKMTQSYLARVRDLRAKMATDLTPAQQQARALEDFGRRYGWGPKSGRAKPDD